MWDKPRLLMWFANLLTGLAVLVLLYALLFLLVHSPLFPVRQVKVDGSLSHVTREQLQYVVKHELKGTFFTLDLDKARQAFEKLPWVRKVTVRRRWPDRLEVAMEEHVALARWGNVALLSTQGERFDAASNDVLPVLEGPDGSEAELARGLVRFRELLAPIGKQPIRIWLSARRAWRLELEDALIVEVGRDEAEQRLHKFVVAYPNSLARLNREFKYVDLRYPNGFAVRLPDFKPVASKAKPA